MPKNGVLRLFMALAILCALVLVSEPSWGRQDAQKPYPGYVPFNPKRPPTEQATIYGPHNKPEATVTGNDVYGPRNKKLYTIQPDSKDPRNSTDPKF